MSSVATPKEFDRTQASAYRLPVSKELFFSGLDTYFQKAKDTGGDLPPSLMRWNVSYLMDVHRTQLPYCQFGTYPFGNM
ncbi:MAG: hypothetical protein ACRD3B_02330 [Candidatus Sulfotelmatobacter sp.]